MKSKLNLIVAGIALIAGFVSSIINKEWFTTYTLIESILILAPVLYFIFKYTFKIFQFNQSRYYKPSKTTKLFHTGFDQVGTLLVEPICLDFIYACLVLFIVKQIDPAKLNLFGNVVYHIWKFNSEHISSPLKVIVFVLSCITLIHIVSVAHFKKAKSFISYFKTPFKFIAILVLFLNVDKGAVSKILEWKLNTEVPEFKKGDKITFNSKEKKNITEMIDVYANMLAREILKVDVKKSRFPTDSISSAAFYMDLEKVLICQRQDPTIEKDLFIGKGISRSITGYITPDNRDMHKDYYGYPDFSDGEKQMINHFYENTDEIILNNSAPPHLGEYTAEVSASPTKLTSFLNMLKADEGPIESKEKNEITDILKDIIGDALGQSVLFERLQNSVAFYSFAKDKAFDVLKDKMVSGFFYLVEKAKNRALRRSDVRFLAESIKTTIKYHMGTVIGKIAESKQLFVDFYNDYVSAIRFKNKFHGNVANISHEEWQQYLDLFPNDPRYYYNKNLQLIKEAKLDEAVCKQIDVEYLKKYIINITDPVARARWKKVILFIEEKKDVVLARESRSSEDWEHVARKWPDLAKTAREEIEYLEEASEVQSSISALPAGSTIDLNQYLLQHPETPIRAEIKEKIRTGEVNVSPEVLATYMPQPTPIIMESEAGSFWETFEVILEHIDP